MTGVPRRAFPVKLLKVRPCSPLRHQPGVAKKSQEVSKDLLKPSKDQSQVTLEVKRTRPMRVSSVPPEPQTISSSSFEARHTNELITRTENATNGSGRAVTPKRMSGLDSILEVLGGLKHLGSSLDTATQPGPAS